MYVHKTPASWRSFPEAVGNRKTSGGSQTLTYDRGRKTLTGKERTFTARLLDFGLQDPLLTRGRGEI